jgi:hypothetical protein
MFNKDINNVSTDRLDIGGCSTDRLDIGGCSTDRLDIGGYSILQDILNVSICNLLYSHKLYALEYIDSGNMISEEYYDKIEKYIKLKLAKCENIEYDNMLNDPDYKILMDIDLIFDDEIFQIDASRTATNINIFDFTRLFIYASLYYKNSRKKIKKLTIFNPLLFIEFNVEINMNIINNILDIIKGYKISSKFKV